MEKKHQYQGLTKQEVEESKLRKVIRHIQGFNLFAYICVV